MGNYYLGDQITIFQEFTVEDVATDPTTVTFTISRPDDVESIYTDADPEVTNPAVGSWELAYAPPLAGHYGYRVVGTGTVIAAIEGEFDVYTAADPIDPLYVTPHELAASLRVVAEGPLFDDLVRACNTASRAIDEECDSRFALTDDSNDEVRVFTALSPGMCQIDDAASITSVLVDMNADGNHEQEWTEFTHYVRLRSSAASVPPHRRPWNRLRITGRSGRSFPTGDSAIQVTGRFGWPATPWQVQEAAGLLAQQLFKRRQEAPFGIVSYGVDQPVAVRLLRKDPHLCLLLEPFARTELG